MKAIITITLILLTIGIAQAASVDFALYANTINNVNQTNTLSQNLTSECDSECFLQIPSFSLSEGEIITDYRIAYDSQLYTITFNSTGTTSSTDPSDQIRIKIVPAEETPQLVCTNSQCDTSCTTCSDNTCHNPGFECIEELNVERISQTTKNLGAGQVNILIKNTGNVELKDIRATISGNGITTIESSPIGTLPPGEKDYTFVGINAEKSGDIDIVIKLYLNGALYKRIPEQISFNAASDEPVAPQYNVTQLKAELSELKREYAQLETDIQGKKADYQMGNTEQKLQSIYELIVEAQEALANEEFRKVKAAMETATTEIESLSEEIPKLKPIQVKTMDKIRNNILYWGTAAAAIVSVITLIGFLKKGVNKENINAITEKVKKNGKKDKPEEKKED